MHVESSIKTHMDQFYDAFLNLRSNMEKLDKENQELRKSNVKLREKQDVLMGSVRGDLIQKLKLENFDFHSDHLEFMWQIENFQRISTTKFDLESPAFSSGSRGYLFCLHAYSSKLFFNFFFCLDVNILHGPHDNTLPWPCELACEITLINKNKKDNRKYVVNDWRDQDLNLIRKKTVITCTFPDNLPISVLHQRGYVAKDSLYIKFMVERHN